jgi:hypothetical protein
MILATASVNLPQTGLSQVRKPATHPVSLDKEATDSWHD